MACLKTCEGNLWETILGCIIQFNVLAGVAVLVAKSPYRREERRGLLLPYVAYSTAGADKRENNLQQLQGVGRKFPESE